MSFWAAAALIRELFPLASGGCADTVRQNVLDVATNIAVQRAAPEAMAPAGSIDLGMDTTFVRSCVPDGPRHHGAQQR